jgi:hypothetical protein
VIKAESQAVLSTFTQPDFQDAFKKGRSAAQSKYARKGTTSRVMVASRPQKRFWPDDSPSPGNYGIIKKKKGKAFP